MRILCVLDTIFLIDDEFNNMESNGYLYIDVWLSLYHGNLKSPYVNKFYKKYLVIPRTLAPKICYI